MNLINRETDYAVRALCHMAKSRERKVTVEKLRAQLRLPRPILRSVLQTLARHKVLKSFRGKGGGFLLGRAPDAIDLSQIVEIFQGEIDLARCLFRGKACPNCATCPLRATVKEIETLARERLRDVTIASLLSASCAPDPSPCERP